MNSRTLLALLTLGALALVAVMAASALADPVDTDNPPTGDWFFDSGKAVTILGKTWDFGYNVTVANKTELTFERCTFVIYDQYGENALWMNVWWNGSLVLRDCRFSSSGDMGYYIVADGNITLEGTTLSDMVQPGYRAGGLSAKGCAVTIKDSTVSGVVGGPAIAAVNCQFSAGGLNVKDSGDASSHGPAVLLTYNGNTPTMAYAIALDLCVISDNVGAGLRIESKFNRADLMVTMSSCQLDRNDWNGLETFFGSEYYYSTDATNCTFDIMMADCQIVDNRDLGIWARVNQVRLDGKATFNVALDSCKIEGNNDGGMNFEVTSFDGVFNLDVKGTSIRDNSINPMNWNCGGAYLYCWDLQEHYNVDFDTTTIEHNGYNGVLANFGSTGNAGSTFNLASCDIKMNQGSGVYLVLQRSYTEFPAVSFDTCTFDSNLGHGIYIYHGWDSGIDYDMAVKDCTFAASTGGGIFSQADRESSDGISWDILRCTFKDLDGPAIQFEVDYAISGSTVTITDCTLNRTGGIRFYAGDSQDTVQAVHVLVIKNTDIVATSAAAVDATIYGYYGVEFDMTLDGVAIEDAQFNGIWVMVSTNYQSLTRSIEMAIELNDVSVDTVTGTGINVGTDRIQYRGTRTFMVDGLTVMNTQKGINLQGVRGEIHGGKIANSLRQDLVVISSDMDLYSIDVSGISASAFQVIEAGSIRFWYDLEIHVMWDTGLRVVDAIVQIMDNHHTLIGSRTQSASEDIPVLTLNTYQLRETGMYTRSPFLLNVTYKAINVLETVQLDSFKSVTVYLADHVSPSVFINDPASGTVQQSLSIKVRGSSFDTESGMDKVEVSIDGQEWFQTTDPTSWSHTFTVDEAGVIDKAGVFVIRARGTDVAGNTATTMVSVGVDPFPPQLLVQFPPDVPNGYQTDKAVLTVRGVTEAGATVLVNGEPVQLAGTLFDHDLTLIEGKNTVTVTSSDALGNIVSKKLTVVLDTKAPFIVLIDPKEGESFISMTANVSGQGEDGLVITINNFVLDSVHYHDGLFQYALSLVRGENLITVKAVDPAGNVARLTRTVFLDDVVPMLSVSEPTDGTYLRAATITVVGSTDIDALVMINDETVDLDHGTFHHTLVGVEGENAIRIVTTDPSGNVATVTLTVWVDTIAPTLVVSSPSKDGEIVSAADFDIMGTTSGASRLTINGLNIDIAENGSFSVPFGLLEGANAFTIVAIDQAGNQETVRTSVVLDTHPPILIVKVTGLSKDKSGQWVFSTKEGTTIMTIRGNTDGALKILVNGQMVPIGEGGFFEYELPLTANAKNTVKITAVDAAGNEKVVTYQDVQHRYASDKADEGFEAGWALLIIGLIILLLAIVIGYLLVSRAGPGVAEPEEKEAELAPAPMPELEVEEEEEEEKEKAPEAPKPAGEEVHEVKVPVAEAAAAAPAPARPKTTAPRRPVPVTPKEAPKPEAEDKDLDEKDAESDLEAEESDQEGI